MKFKTYKSGEKKMLVRFILNVKTFKKGFLRNKTEKCKKKVNDKLELKFHSIATNMRCLRSYLAPEEKVILIHSKSL